MRKKMIKKSAVALTMALTLAAMAGCGSNTKTAEPANSTTAESTAAATTAAPEKTPDATEAPKVTITLLTDNTQDTINSAKALTDAFEKKYPNIHVEAETRPGGDEGDNLVKTRLATSDMTDVFFYNVGSLMQALKPEDNMLDLTNEPFMQNVMDSFKQTVTFNGKQYAAPFGASMGGGWFYNKKIFADLGLSVPKTWAELLANNGKIKAAGITPVIGSYKDAWTAQLVVLADQYNVQAAEPKFAENYTANKAGFAKTPAALRSFEKLGDLAEGGHMNKDLNATNYDDGLKMLAEGKGAQYPMLTFAIPAIEQNYPDKVKDIGFFAQPGDSADNNGLTIWMPGGAYIYNKSKHIEEAKKFVEFTASLEGIAAISTVSKPSGPYVVNGAKLPDNVSQIVKDMLPYFDTNKTAPALEFVSPVKGPGLPQITVEVGSGFKTGKQGAEVYDKDVEKQAKQLGLQGW